MSKHIQCILLIDDDPDDNFLHSMVIEEAGVCDVIKITEKATDALRYLTDTDHADYVRPDIIVLDINMPGMNGFEFMKRYGQLPAHTKAQVVLVMLTTSLNPADKATAATVGINTTYYHKPLTRELLLELVDTYCA